MIKCYEELLLLFKLLCKKLIFISASTMCGWSHSAHCKVLNPILPSAFLIAALDFFFFFASVYSHLLSISRVSDITRLREEFVQKLSFPPQPQCSTDLRGGSDIRELAVQSHPGIQQVASPEKAGGETPAAHRLSHHPYLGCTRQSEQ